MSVTLTGRTIGVVNQVTIERGRVKSVERYALETMSVESIGAGVMKLDPFLEKEVEALAVQGRVTIVDVSSPLKETEIKIREWLVNRYLPLRKGVGRVPQFFSRVIPWIKQTSPDSWTLYSPTARNPQTGVRDDLLKFKVGDDLSDCFPPAESSAAAAAAAAAAPTPAAASVKK